MGEGWGEGAQKDKGAEVFLINRADGGIGLISLIGVDKPNRANKPNKPDRANRGWNCFGGLLRACWGILVAGCLGEGFAGCGWMWL